MVRLVDFRLLDLVERRLEKLFLLDLDLDLRTLLRLVFRAEDADLVDLTDSLRLILIFLKDFLLFDLPPPRPVDLLLLLDLLLPFLDPRLPPVDLLPRRDFPFRPFRVLFPRLPPRLFPLPRLFFLPLFDFLLLDRDFVLRTVLVVFRRRDLVRRGISSSSGFSSPSFFLGISFGGSVGSFLEVTVVVCVCFESNDLEIADGWLGPGCGGEDDLELELGEATASSV